MTGLLPRLPGCDVGYFVLDLRSPIASRLRKLCWLNSEEKDRCKRLTTRGDRERFLLGRTLLRCALGQALGISREEIAFTFEQFGRPALEADPTIGFNLSHSGHFVAAAITSLGPQLGIDVEILTSEIETDTVAETIFAPCELEKFNGLSYLERRDYFIRLWTLKEAQLKATGMGLRFDPRLCVVDDELVNEPARLPEEHRLASLRWWRYQKWITPGVSLAVALNSNSPPEIRELSVETLLS